MNCSFNQQEIKAASESELFPGLGSPVFVLQGLEYVKTFGDVVVMLLVCF